MYTRNNTGPKTEPCGTSYVTNRELDLTPSSTTAPEIIYPFKKIPVSFCISGEYVKHDRRPLADPYGSVHTVLFVHSFNDLMVSSAYFSRNPRCLLWSQLSIFARSLLSSILSSCWQGMLVRELGL